MMARVRIISTVNDRMRPLKFLNNWMRPDKNLNDCMRPEYYNPAISHNSNDFSYSYSFECFCREQCEYPNSA
jgi:hypothetical protein